MAGRKVLNIIFRQNLPRSEKHRISLVENKIATEPGEPETPETLSIGEDGYVHLELRYNTYDDVTDYWGGDEFPIIWKSSTRHPKKVKLR